MSHHIRACWMDERCLNDRLRQTFSCLCGVRSILSKSMRLSRCFNNFVHPFNMFEYCATFQSNESEWRSSKLYSFKLDMFLFQMLLNCLHFNFHFLLSQRTLWFYLPTDDNWNIKSVLNSKWPIRVIFELIKFIVCKYIDTLISSRMCTDLCLLDFIILFCFCIWCTSKYSEIKIRAYFQFFIIS